MLLGKRPRPPMSRTISMKEIDADLGLAEDSPMPSDQNITATIAGNPQQQLQHLESKHQRWPGDYPAAFRRSKSADLAATVETAPFLKSCGLCNCSLNLNRDIFMYRGEIAFCSLECRQQLINQEDRLKNSARARTSLSEPSCPGKTVAAT